MSDRVYPYTGRNLLVEVPYHYHYSDYEGVSLLWAYRTDRQNRIAALLETDDDLARVFQTDNLEPGKALKPDGLTPTVDLLMAAARRVVANTTEDDAGIDFLVRELRRKFEVAKRLRAVYDHTWKKVGVENAPVRAYALLAFLIAEKATGAGDLQALNALLKLDDHVLSAIGPDVERVSASAIRRAVIRELELIETLMRNKGVML